jgi:hypothetical protein
MPLTVPGTDTAAGMGANVRAYGAVGDGVVDDTAAIQAAIDAWTDGGPVFLPQGVYRITSALSLKSLTHLIGTGYNRYGKIESPHGSHIDAEAAGCSALTLPASARGVNISNLGLYGDAAAGTGVSASNAGELHIDNVYIDGFSNGISLSYVSGLVLTRSFITTQGSRGLSLVGCGGSVIGGCQIANGVAGNIYLSACSSTTIDMALVDEGGAGPSAGGNLTIMGSSNITFRCPMMFLSTGCYSIWIGPTCSNITLYDTNIIPFALDRVGTGMIKIEAGASDVRLINVVTDPNGAPVDIDDQGTNTLWINTNGRTKLPVVATASLPAAGATEDGRLLIEDAGGVGNLIFYVDGARYRVAGTAAAIDLALGPVAIPVTAVAPTMSGGAAPSGLLTGLAAYWKLEETSGTRADSVGTSHLTDNNTVTSNPGIQGTAAQFTAANSESLSVVHNAALAVGNFDFSIALWVYFDTVATSHVFNKWAAGQGSYILYYDSGSGRFAWLLSTDGTVQDVHLPMDALGTPLASTWHFITLIHDAAANTLTVQGDTTTAYVVAHSAGVFAGTAPVEIGANLGSPYLNGRVDEVGYWTRTLTGTERTNLYAAGAGVTYPFTGIP